MNCGKQPPLWRGVVEEGNQDRKVEVWWLFVERYYSFELVVAIPADEKNLSAGLLVTEVTFRQNVVTSCWAMAIALRTTHVHRHSILLSVKNNPITPQRTKETKFSGALSLGGCGVFLLHLMFYISQHF